MKIADYFKKYDFNDIKQELSHLMEVNRGKALSEDEALSFETQYNSMKKDAEQYGRFRSSGYVKLVDIWENNIPIVDWNCHICGAEHDEQYPLVEFMIYDSKDIYAMKLVVAEDVVINEREITSGLLWEMNYYTNFGIEVCPDKSWV